MDRAVLIKGFLKIFVPLGLGSLAAACVGTLVGTLLGLGAHHTFFFIVVPIMAGGVGEGAIPLSIGYGGILGIPQGDVFAQVLPPVMLGSLTAIILAGTLNWVGKRKPHLTGEGRLQPDTENDMEAARPAETGPIDAATVAAAGLTAVTLYLLGVMCHHLTGLPAPVAMLFLAVLAKLASAVSPRLQAGGFIVYKFVQVGMTYPLLFAIGVSLTPWDKLVAAFTLPNLITIVATVVTLMGDRLPRRAPPRHVSDRGRHRERLPQRPGRHRRCRHPHRRQPDGADALRPDRHPHRRRAHGDGNPGVPEVDHRGAGLSLAPGLRAKALNPDPGSASAPRGGTRVSGISRTSEAAASFGDITRS